MSVAAMADNRLMRATPEAVEQKKPAVVDVEEVEQLPDGAKVPGVKASVLNDVVQWIPIETIGAYVFLQGLLLDPLNPAKKQELHQLDFDERWVLFAIGLALTAVSIPLYTAVKQKQATADFRFPLAETIIGTSAFVLWALALPDTPASDWEWWNAEYGVAAIAISVVVLNPVAILTGIKAQWGKAVAPASG